MVLHILSCYAYTKSLRLPSDNKGESSLLELITGVLNLKKGRFDGTETYFLIFFEWGVLVFLVLGLGIYGKGEKYLCTQVQS